MSERRNVPVAYVTRWATTLGIRVIRNAEETETGALSRIGKGAYLYLAKGDWTEDKAEAEARYRAKLDAARKAAQRKVEKLTALYKADPKYTEG